MDPGHGLMEASGPALLAGLMENLIINNVGGIEDKLETNYRNAGSGLWNDVYDLYEIDSGHLHFCQYQAG